MFYRWQSLGTRSCLLSGAPGALMAFWAMLSRYLYARQADWCRLKAKSERSRRDLRDSFIRFSTREAIRVRRLCNECTNQPPCSPPFWRTLSRFAFRSFASLRVYFPLFLSPFIHTHTHTHTRPTSFVFRLARTIFQSPTMQTSRLRPIYISISWLAGWSRVDKSGQFSRRRARSRPNEPRTLVCPRRGHQRSDLISLTSVYDAFAVRIFM